MKLTKIILFLLTLIIPLFGQADSDNKSTRQITPIEAKRDKDKEKKSHRSKKKKETTSLSPQQLYDSSIKKVEAAQQKESSVPRTLKNINEVSASLNAAALLYDQAVFTLKQVLQLVTAASDKQFLEKMIGEFEGKARECRKEAVEWPAKVFAQKNALKERLTFLKNESSSLKTDGSGGHYWDVQKQIVGILQELINIGEGNPYELAALQAEISAFGSTSSNIEPSEKISSLSPEELRNIFYHSLSEERLAENSSDSRVIPLDGQTFSGLYTDQFYRYLVQRDFPASYLRVKVYENHALIHEEKISIPVQNTLSWEHYIAFDQMISIPETVLQSRFGLDLRMTIVSDPYHNFSLLVAHQAAQTNYTFAFSLEESLLYELNFTVPPPWQLEALRKPALFKGGKPLQAISPSIPLSINNENSEAGPELMQDFRLDQFVKEMKSDPLALTQYVYNEIEFNDPFVTRRNGLFLAPSIHRSAYGTFLEKQGSPWEQCALLIYLLRQAGYQALYTEGTCTLPASVVEKLLFLQLPGENEVSLNYPGVLFFDQQHQQWISLYPWMKEVDIHEGHELYSFMPKEYANADLWIRRYLCNDENILKHIGPEGDDTAGILFTRFVEK